MTKADFSPGVSIGQPVDRVDGRAKVTGQAKYAAEHPTEKLLHGVIHGATIARGRITKIDTARALAVPGVIDVFTHRHRPDLAWFNRKYKDDDAPPGEHFRALQGSEIKFRDQPIALIVAERFEQARYAATLIDVEYSAESPVTDLQAERKNAHPVKKSKMGFERPKSRGKVDEAFAAAEKTVQSEFHTAMEHHNPMEMHATTVVRAEDGSYTIYDKTQGIANSVTYVCNVFGLKPEQVRVRAPYVGGAFGSALRPQIPLYMAMLASTELKRSVRVVLTRQQMFTYGHRPAAIQTLRMGTDAAGNLSAISHETVMETSRFEDYAENVVNWSGILYECKNVHQGHLIANLDLYTPLDMRAPGATTGVYALEVAMDEMAYAAGVDPLEFRRKNYAERDQAHFGRPFSSKELGACYAEGAEKFGWARRDPNPRSQRDGKKLVGWGMATGIWDAMRMKAAAEATYSEKGLLIRSAITDIGTGTYTILTQIAAETLGLPISEVKTELADSDFAEAPLQGGSWSAASVGTAVQAACLEVGEKIFKLAQKLPDSPFAKVKYSDVTFVGGGLELKEDSNTRMKLSSILRRSECEEVRVTGKSAPNLLKELPFAKHTHSAVFVEVKVDEDHGMVEVTRVVSAIAAGRILNPKTARSQIIGGVVWGIGQALHEESVVDHRLGRIMNPNFAEYHIPVNRDVPPIEVIFVKEHDEIVNPMGIKGVGEIGIVGVAAAIANAIFHATGKRVRNLPIHLEDLFD